MGTARVLRNGCLGAARALLGRCLGAAWVLLGCRHNGSQIARCAHSTRTPNWRSHGVREA
eukprot:11216005-Lingulodinium_polyedra.AAC.1